MDKTGVDNASGAEVPVRAIQTLVTDAIDVLITSIADSVMFSIAAWLK
jgi:hypothetical protein